MTQDERWTINYDTVTAFIKANKRRPSKYNPEERNLWNWLRHTQKQLGAGELKEQRVAKFKMLLEMCEKYKHINQYV